MVNDNQVVTGQLSWVLRDEFGNVKESKTGPNLIVTVGKALLASLLAGTSSTIMTEMAIGSSSTAPAVTDTALVSELARVPFTSTTPVSNVVTYIANFGIGIGTGTIQETGLFSAHVAGTMLSRSTSINVVKASGDTLQITWTITFN